VQIIARSDKAQTTVVVRCDDSMEARARWLADTMAEYFVRGRGLGDGSFVEVGWSILRLARQPDASLLVQEPDFGKNPFQEFRDEVTTTLKVLSAQENLHGQLGVQSTRCRFDQKVVLRKDVLSETSIIAIRQDPTERDSGWYIGPADTTRPASPPPVEDLEAIYLYQLIELRPSLLVAMALPAGYMVKWSGDEIQAMADGENRNLWSPAKTTPNTSLERTRDR
jgi:hypothetical protein